MRYTQQGDAVTNFSVAVSYKELTTWYRVSAWRKLAETCEKYVTKGMKVYVDGRLDVETYTRKDGGMGVSLNLTANNVTFMSRGDQQQGSPAAPDGKTLRSASADGRSECERQRRGRRSAMVIMYWTDYLMVGARNTRNEVGVGMIDSALQYWQGLGKIRSAYRRREPIRN